MPLPPEGADDQDVVITGSPYASDRALVQNLTLPAMPCFDIPASPPGSPPLKATKKFAQFLELKKKGQHFNQRLEGSSVLRDPGHLRKLMEFAGISEQNSYTSTLSKEVAVPPVFPKWSYLEELRLSHVKLVNTMAQEKSKGPRETVEFVSGGTSQNKLGDLSTSAISKRKKLEHRGRDSSTSRPDGSRSPKRKRSRSRDRQR